DIPAARETAARPTSSPPPHPELQTTFDRRIALIQHRRFRSIEYSTREMARNPEAGPPPQADLRGITKFARYGAGTHAVSAPAVQSRTGPLRRAASPSIRVGFPPRPALLLVFLDPTC